MVEGYTYVQGKGSLILDLALFSTINNNSNISIIKYIINTQHY